MDSLKAKKVSLKFPNNEIVKLEVKKIEIELFLKKCSLKV